MNYDAGALTQKYPLTLLLRDNFRGEGLPGLKRGLL